jgi:hypothetical protein
MGCLEGGKLLKKINNSLSLYYMHKIKRCIEGYFAVLHPSPFLLDLTGYTGRLAFCRPPR